MVSLSKVGCVHFSCGCKVVFGSTEGTRYYPVLNKDDGSSFCSLKDEILLNVAFPSVYSNNWLKLISNNNKKKEDLLLKKHNQILEKLVDSEIGIITDETKTDLTVEDFCSKFIVQCETKLATEPKDSIFYSNYKDIIQKLSQLQSNLSTMDIDMKIKEEYEEAISVLTSLTLLFPSDADYQKSKDFAIYPIQSKIANILGFEANTPGYRKFLYGTEKIGSTLEYNLK